MIQRFKMGFLIGIILLLPLLSGCSTFLQSDSTSKSDQKQGASQKGEGKFSAQQVADKALARLEQAPGWHVKTEESQNKMAVEVEYLGANQFCTKIDDKLDQATVCYESPILHLKSNNSPAITFDLSNPENGKELLKEKDMAVFFAFPELFSPKKAIGLFRGNSNVKMEEQGDHYLLKTTISAKDYYSVMSADLEKQELAKKSADLKNNLKYLMDDLLKQDIERNYQYNIQVKVDKKQFAVKEIYYDFPDADFQSVSFGEISKLTMK